MVALGAAPVFATSVEREPVAIVREWRPQEASPPPGRRVEPPILWTVAGVAAISLTGGTFYLLKRRVGGFPANPAWVAPISVMPSSDSPDEGTYGDAPADSHGTHD